MRLGIDLDGTISSTGEIYRNRIKKFAKDNNTNIIEAEENPKLKHKFLSEYSKDIFENVKIKKDAARVLNKLKEKHEIYIITARSNDFVPNIKDVNKICKDWFNKHNIEVDKIITGVNGIDKVKACKENKIDIMIEDNHYNYQLLIENNIKCLLFDDNNEYNEINNKVTSWKEIEKYMEGKD